jgi:hypothetical protein
VVPQGLFRDRTPKVKVRRENPEHTAHRNSARAAARPTGFHGHLAAGSRPVREDGGGPSRARPSLDDSHSLRGVGTGERPGSREADGPTFRLGGLKDASTDPEQIFQWRERWPDANIGGVTGIVYDVFDVDPDGLDTLSELVGGDDTVIESGPVIRTCALAAARVSNTFVR